MKPIERQLIKVQDRLKEWHKREPEDIKLVCVSKKEIKKLNSEIEFVLLGDSE